MRFRENRRNGEMKEPGASRQQIAILSFDYFALVIMPTYFLLIVKAAFVSVLFQACTPDSSML
jgi:hypothetical protein